MSDATNPVAQSLVPMLKKGANYDFWSLKMKTMFKSRELWDMAEKGFIDNQTEEPDQPLRENRKKDAKALFLIQQALHDEIFPLIASATTSTHAWEILKQEYSRNKKETSITMHSNSEAPKNKNKEVWREPATRRDAKKEKEEDFENAILVVVTLIITLTYQALLNPPSTLFKQGTEIQWGCLFSRKQGLINDMKNCPAKLAFAFLFLNTLIFLHSILVLLLTLRGRRGFLLTGLTMYFTVCYFILLMAFSYYTAYVAIPLCCLAVLIIVLISGKEYWKLLRSRYFR